MNGFWKVKVSDFERFLAARHVHRSRVFVEARDEFKQAISAAGYDVVTASNLWDALLKLSQAMPALLVLVLESQSVPAISLLIRKQKIKAMKKIPTVVVGELSETDLNTAMKLGVVASASDAATIVKEFLSALMIR